MIYKLENTIQPYAWGSASLLPEFLGLPNPGGGPMAELWMGAHPKAPSRAAAGRESAALDALVASDPAAFLGDRTARRFDSRLPFLFKVIAAGRPLSIQCHPDEKRAREGFERENRLGIPLDAPERNYRDPNHKPEIIIAVSEFTALRGLRPAREIAGFFARLPVPQLRAAAEELGRNDGPDGIQKFLRFLLSVPRETARRWMEACRGSGPAAESALMERLAGEYPGDPGCFAPLYLNLAALLPGEAMFLGAGELHAYVEGLGVELMANSDNVLRGGLTSKHVDVDELLAALDCRPGQAEILRPRARNSGGGFVEAEYPAPAAEFAVSVLENTATADSGGAAIANDGPEILLCGAGRALIRGGENSHTLRRGESVFVPASEPSYRVEGKCRLYRARVPS